MAGKRGEWLYDELLNYVASPLFQAPVVTFMEANCLIFDPALEDCKEYRELHGAYCALVTVLLDAFRDDTNLTHDHVIKAMTDMSRRTELREVFSGLFELILATESFRLFSRLMTQKNLELQQQALMLIMKQYGNIPEIMQMSQPSSAPPSEHKPQSSAPPAAISAPTSADSAPKDSTVTAAAMVKRQEADVMESIMRSTESSSQPAQRGKDADEVKRSAVAEAGLIKVESEKEQQKLEQAMKELMVEEKPTTVSTESRDEAVVSKPALPRLTSHAPTPTPSQQAPIKVVKPVPVVAGGDAAAQWIAQAKAENDQATVSAVQTAAATFAQMSPEELKKRQAHLQEQRQKLMAMKQKEREKQLDSYEKATPSRPKSARVARSILSRAPATSSADPKDEEKKKELEMRRAIANRLKAEVLGK